mgnify:FL=1
MRDRTFTASLFNLVRTVRTASDLGESLSDTTVVAGIPLRITPVKASELTEGLQAKAVMFGKVAIVPSVDVRVQDVLVRISDSRRWNVLAIEEDPAGQAVVKYLIVGRQG